MWPRVMVKAASAHVEFRRLGGFVDMLRAYKLLVNGQEVGRIKRKSTLQVAVPVGSISIGARIDWCQAEPLELTLDAGETAVVEVVNTHGALKSGYAIVGGAWNYLTLIHVR